MRKWSGEVMVGGSKFWVEVGGRQGREEWEKESFVSPWRKSREEDTERVRRKAKGGGEGEEHDPTVELFNAHWREVENFEEVENATKVEEERQVCRIAEEEQEREVEEEQEREMEEEGSDEDWGQEVEAYSRRGGLGVRFVMFCRMCFQISLFEAGTILSACTLLNGGERINSAPRTGIHPLSIS